MSNIILIGFMGTGKTEIGRRLSDFLDYSFIDTDSIMENVEGMSISAIFKEKGEPYFRNLETETIKTLSDYSKFVISTGGGIVLKEENIFMLKKLGYVILLYATPEVIVSRLRFATDRPLLQVEDKEMKIKEILAQRDSFYNKAADFKIDTSNKTPEDIVKEIVNLLPIPMK